MSEKEFVQPSLFVISNNDTSVKDQPENNNPQVIIDPERASLRNKIRLPKKHTLCGKDRASGEKDKED